MTCRGQPTGGHRAQVSQPDDRDIQLSLLNGRFALSSGSSGNDVLIAGKS